MANQDLHDEIFQAEQHHLNVTYTHLQSLREELTQEIDTSHHGARQDLIDLSEEVRLNFGSPDETMETLAAIETLNSIIDTYNESHDITVNKLARVLLLLEQPYFAKVTLLMRPDRPPRDIYIGTVGITDSDANPLIIDWRSPVAATYYNQEMGKTSYEVAGRIRTVELTLRRQFDILRDQLRSYFDTTIAIEDALLLEALRRRHSEKLQAITATIQREQNAIIRHKDVGVLLVFGIAGSGKTSVMLQRIAYLLYRQRTTLNVKQVWLFTPSAVFERYIDTVLPQLGESNPNIGTWEDFLAGYGLAGRNDGAGGDPNHLRILEDSLCTLELSLRDFRSVEADGAQLIRPLQVQAAWDAYAQFPVGPRRCALTSEKLHDALERKFGRMSHEEFWQERMLELDMETQVRVFGHIVDAPDEKETTSLTRTYLAWRFAAAHDSIEALSWLRLDRIGTRILHTESLTAAEHLWLRLIISGHGTRDARYVVIDEVQDYTALQLMVLARNFRGAHFLLLGDPHQAIRKGTASWDDIRRIFTSPKTLGTVAPSELQEFRLLTSYRSSPEITALFVGLLDHDEQVHLTSVQEAGHAPLIRELPFDAWLDVIRSAARDAASKEGLCAIITEDRPRARWLSKQLAGTATLLTRDDTLPPSGVVVVNLTLAKGLEFDRVIIPDAQAEVYPDTALSRRRLYTAISRATHEITIYSQGPMTPLLAGLAHEARI